MNNQSLIIIMLFAILLSANTQAATITAVSCSQADVQAAVNAASEGDVVIVPAGSCTWTSSQVISKALTIKGSNTTLTAGALLSNGFFYITGFASNATMRITGFTFMSRVSDIESYTANIKVLRNIALGNLRIDHNIFHYGYVSIDMGGSFGVIDHNYFYNPRQGIAFTAGSRAQADASWESLDAGTSKSLFIEDNYFITDQNYPLSYTQEQIATYNGGKLVVRYNNFNATTVSDTLGPYTPFMAHGSADGGCGGAGYWESSSCQRRGQSVIEFYNNLESGKRIDFMYITRGSANLIYNNMIVGTVRYNPRIMLTEEEYFSDNWAIHRTQWPAEDQVHNTFIWNNTYRGHDFNDGVYGSVETTPTDHTCTGAGIPMSCCSGLDAGTCGSNSNPTANPFLRKDRDYFLHAPCGASDITDGYGNNCTYGKEIFTGANGASSSYPTDGTVYPNAGTMIFNPTGDNAYYGYEPYIYPHPLTLEEPDAIIAASCSYNDVAAAVSDADYEDVVSVPAGDCIWSSALTITKGIRFQGAGVDKTIIRFEIPNSAYIPAISFSPDQSTAVNNYPFSISGFTFAQNLPIYSHITLSNQYLNTPLTKVKIHGNKFIGKNGTGMGVIHNLAVFGVVYNNTFVDLSHVWRFLGGGSGWSDVEEWKPGTGNAMYYEDNYGELTADHESSLIVSGGGGNRYVARYNTMNLTMRPTTKYTQAYDIHGNQDNNPTGGIGNELYGNLRLGAVSRWIDHRGGQVFFFYNRWKGGSNSIYVHMREEYNDDTFCPAVCGENNYPRTALGNCLQRPRDSYYWRNYIGPTEGILLREMTVTRDHYNSDAPANEPNNPLTLFENQAYFRDNTNPFDGSIDPIGSCGYYNGTACTKSGIGCGTLTEMNSIAPSASGLGFWVTEQSCTDISGMIGISPATPINGRLYRSQPDGAGGYAWKEYYSPYVYPHPLRLAPDDASICKEGMIESDCWCEGIKSDGYCCHGYYQTEDCISSQEPINIPGDVNKDGIVSILDIQLIVLDFGKTSGYNSNADLNIDGKINLFDVMVVVRNWGRRG